MLTCYLCNEETCLTSYFCSDCNYIKRILQCYGRDQIKEIITKVCIRNKKQMDNKIDIIKGKLEKEEKKEESKKECLGDETYIIPNESVLEELKKKLSK
jgi:hypothetical protein